MSHSQSATWNLLVRHPEIWSCKHLLHLFAANYWFLDQYNKCSICGIHKHLISQTKQNPAKLNNISKFLIVWYIIIFNWPTACLKCVDIWGPLAPLKTKLSEKATYYITRFCIFVVSLLFSAFVVDTKLCNTMPIAKFMWAFNSSVAVSVSVLYLFFISSECLFGVTKCFICLHNKLHLFT